MARSHGRIKVEIWGDPDFRALTKDEQRAYFMLLSQPQISNCGALSYAPRRLARLAADETIEGLERALDGLHEKRFIVIDDETDEILIRTYVEHDGILSSPNMTKAAQRELHDIVSVPLREVLAEGFPEVFLERFKERFPEPSLNYSVNGFPRARARLNHSGNPFPRARPAPLPPTESRESLTGVRDVSKGSLSLDPFGEEQEQEPSPASPPTDALRQGDSALSATSQQERVRTIACPTCDAPVGEPCRDEDGGEREANHRARQVAYLDGPGAKTRKTGWRFVRGTHGGSYVPDPEGVDRPPSGYADSYREAEERRAREEANRPAPDDEDLSPDPEGLRRLAETFQSAAERARPAPLPTPDSDPEALAEAIRRQEASREWLRKNAT
jgi:hypothetical protein